MARHVLRGPAERRSCQLYRGDDWAAWAGWPVESSTSRLSYNALRNDTEVPVVDSGIAREVEDVIECQLRLQDRKVEPDMSFVDDLGADSLALVDLTLALEEAFDIDIQTDDVERLFTVQDAIDYVAGCLSSRTPRRLSVLPSMAC